MTTKIIYHALKRATANSKVKPCPDGIAAAWVASKIYPDAELIGWEYQIDPPDVNDADTLIIVDFSFPKSVLQAWIDRGCEITVIDHHKTAQSLLEGFAGGVLRFDMTRCGAMLTWEYFFPDKPVPIFIKYVNDQDMWEWKLPYSEAIREAFGILGRTFELFNKLESMSQDEFLAYMVPIGQPLVDARKKKVAQIASRHFWGYVGKYCVPCVYLRKGEEGLTSDICAYLYKQFPSAPFTLCFNPLVDIPYFWHNPGWNYSIRSDKDNLRALDVGDLAKSFGGGGHKHAAGFSVEEYVG
jgi:hypothetical protein